ncbi:MAG: hypothetical protein KME25_00810 [Symplocastrum torsivum CPER-KK1]|uniref:Uncharacterized protein n=1 Tax=Symplocastrum torsivum CPER-KK1 TaxID=450513 RepID=A0A951PGA1_9CYAN|nr:hypothetical protein [Symplocastrum torsivum CPER-KK1]
MRRQRAVPLPIRFATCDLVQAATLRDRKLYLTLRLARLASDAPEPILALNQRS